MMVAFAALFSLVACEKNQTKEDEPNKPGKKLEAPVLRSETDGETSFTIKWDAVKGAETYMLNLTGDNYTTTECEYTFENLNAGSYTVRVKSIGTGYTDSDFANITVTLKGASEIDWFEQTIVPAAVDEENGYYPYNAFDVVWKGTGVKDLLYGLFETSAVAGIDDATIIDNLKSVDIDVINAVNSAEGLAATFGPVNGGTSYTLFAYVTNEVGIKFLVRGEATTETVEASEEASMWFGTWSVKSHQIYTIDDKGKGTQSNKEDEFAVTITASSNDPYEVVIDGLSVLGEGWPTVGVVEENLLYILNGTFLGYSESGDYYYNWLAWFAFPEAYGGTQISVDAYPSLVLEMDENGAVTCTNKYSMEDSEGNEVPVECLCCDVFGLNDKGNIYFLIEAFPGIYRSGDMDWTRTEAQASALRSVPLINKNLSVLPTSLVVAE